MSPAGNAGAPLEIRRFDATRDAASLRQCIVDHQDFHRSIETSWPDGETIAAEYMAYLHAQCAAHNGCIFMAYCGDRAAGFVCVVANTRNESPDDPAPYAWIQDIYVTPASRRQGVATSLMAEAERFARAEGAVVLRLGVLHGNSPARSFYGRHGFREHTHVLTKPLE